MTDLIFTFDTEDYVNEKGADGIIRASKMVRDAGFTPCHNIVGWLAEALLKWGRQDCINELCCYCPKVQREHLGACDGCRWKKIKGGWT